MTIYENLIPDYIKQSMSQLKYEYRKETLLSYFHGVIFNATIDYIKQAKIECGIEITFNELNEIIDQRFLDEDEIGELNG